MSHDQLTLHVTLQVEMKLILHSQLTKAPTGTGSPHGRVATGHALLPAVRMQHRHAVGTTPIQFCSDASRFPPPSCPLPVQQSTTRISVPRSTSRSNTDYGIALHGHRPPSLVLDPSMDPVPPHVSRFTKNT